MQPIQSEIGLALVRSHGVRRGLSLCEWNPSFNEYSGPARRGQDRDAIPPCHSGTADPLGLPAGRPACARWAKASRATSRNSLSGLEAFDFRARHRDNAAKILETYRSTNSAQARGEPITPAAQWLLDNNYLVEETIFQIKRDLPQRFYRQLPTMKLAGRRRSSARAGPGLGLCGPFGQRRIVADAEGAGRRLPERRAAEDRRTMGAAVAAALRTDRESCGALPCA